MEGYVKVSDEKGLRTIEFFHPAHNSLPSHLLKKLADTILEAGQDPSVSLILLKSAGDRTFCAGASFTELVAIEDFPTGKEFFMGFARVINAVRNCPKIVLGRIHGKAIGGGVGLASACDYALANKYASVRLSELAVGIGPFVIGPAVERKIGRAQFGKMALSPEEWQTAEWAKEKGLFTECFDSTEQLDEYIGFFTEKLLSYNPTALMQIKEILWQGTSDWDQLLEERAEMSGKLVLSEFSKKAINKFLNA